MKPPIDWLLAGPAYVEYMTRRDLLDEPEDSAAVVDAKKRMLADPRIESIIQEVTTLPWKVLNSHKSASHPTHLLELLADLNIEATGRLKTLADALAAAQSPGGAYTLLMDFPDKPDGPAWALCDAPVTLYNLSAMRAAPEDSIARAAKHIAGVSFENGWHCTVSPALGNFRGPGRKDDPCPFANLVSVKALSTLEGYKDSEVVNRGIEATLGQWENRREAHYYMFFMGTDFCKLKVPLMWYDILHVTDVLSRFSRVLKDKRFLEMADIVFSKADDEGRFTPEAAYQYYKNWDFGQKKVPSEFLTFLVHRIYRRLDR